MNNSKAIIAITALAILATTIALMSCKKDNGNASNQKDFTIQQAADIRQMEDPWSYIIDFKKKLTESKSNEAFDINDAAWHLACLANLDFCNINVNCDDFQFDSVEMQVNVTDGIILLGDLRTAYEQMCMEIRQFKKGFNHCDQNLYYINVSIAADGNTRIALMTSFTIASKDDHTWYFSNYAEAYLACNEYFSLDSTYVWDSLAVSELTRVLNLFEHYDSPTIGPGGSIVQCYFPTRNHTFKYPDYLDPYGSPFFNNSRTFIVMVPTSTYILSLKEMCYCLDSYLGLGYDFISDNTYPNEHPVCWLVIPDYSGSNSNPPYFYYHQLKVDYGQLITPNLPGPPSD